MALAVPLTVQIERKLDRSFGDLMSEIRSWLDHQKIEPILFKQIGEDGLRFEMVFASEEAADLFRRQFSLAD